MVIYSKVIFILFKPNSKFLLEGSQRVGVSMSQNTVLELSPYIRPDGSAVLIILNRLECVVIILARPVVMERLHYYILFDMKCFCISAGLKRTCTLRFGIKRWAFWHQPLHVTLFSHCCGTDNDCNTSLNRLYEINISIDCMIVAKTRVH